MNSKHIIVAQFEDGKLLAKYRSLTEAAYWSEAQTAHIGKVANGKRKTANGFGWKHDTTVATMSNKSDGIRQTDNAGNIVAVYATPEVAARMTAISTKRITKAMSTKRKAGGFNWS